MHNFYCWVQQVQTSYVTIFYTGFSNTSQTNLKTKWSKTSPFLVSLNSYKDLILFITQMRMMKFGIMLTKPVRLETKMTFTSEDKFGVGKE